MRIISGIYKGKKLLEPIDKKTRPLKDLVKESIFNLLLHSNYINLSLKDSFVLDLFTWILFDLFSKNNIPWVLEASFNWQFKISKNINDKNKIL